MRCGLFGKLGSKRDFVAVATPRTFLETWEPWMQACLAASRNQLGDGWQSAYLSAPIWRFWLGADVCGASVAGAMMPSLDAVGRYYPLTLHAIADDATSIVPPDADAQDTWFGDAEAFLLSTLEPATPFDTTTAGLEQLRPPAVHTAKPDFIRDGNLVGARADADFAAALAGLRAANPDALAAATFWWTAGGSDFPQLALNCRGLPNPYHYATMLTGAPQGAPAAA